MLGSCIGIKLNNMFHIIIFLIGVPRCGRVLKLRNANM